jgi:arylformamidase
VLFIHGGVWRPQHRRLFRGWTGLYSNIGSFLARNGIAAAIAGYRQSQGVSALGAIDDLKAATHFVRAHAAEWEISAEQFFIAGHSGGGHLALTLANTERPNGVISLAGFYDCARFEATLEGKQRLGFKAVFDDVLGNTAIRSPGQGFVKRPLPLLLGIAEHDPASLHVEFEQLSRLCQDSKVPISTLDVKSCDHMGLVLEIGASNDVIGPVLVEFIRRFASNPERAAQAKP